MNINKNYGDASRGEVVVDDNNNIYIAASTTSTNFPTTNCTSCSKAGGQDAVVLKLNPSGQPFNGVIITALQQMMPGTV